jgi:hypothetical protein
MYTLFMHVVIELEKEVVRMICLLTYRYIYVYMYAFT